MEKIVNALRKISVLEWVCIFLFLTTSAIFAAIADENILEKNYIFDNAVLSLVKADTAGSLTKTMQIITFFGSTTFLLPAYIIMCGLLIWKNKKSTALDVFIVAASSTLVMFLLKNYFHRHRPISVLADNLVTYSFPSGHTVSSFVFCSICAYLVWKTSLITSKKYAITFLLLLYTMAVGMSRIILMVHYATDVIAGYCFAIAWLIFSFWTIKLIREHYFKNYSYK